MNKIVCITGMPGAGKSVVSDFFVSKGYHFVRFGQIVLDIVKKKKLPLGEPSERKVREDIRKKYGMGALATLNYPKFKSLIKKGNVIADGLYSWSEYKFLKEKFGKYLILIAVYAPPSLRYERISKRVIPKNDNNLRYRPFTKREAESRDYAEIENLEKGGPIAMAEYTIMNTEDLSYFSKQIKGVYNKIEMRKLKS